MNISWAVEQAHVSVPFSGTIGYCKVLSSEHSAPPFSSARINCVKPHCRATDGQRWAQKPCTTLFLREAAVNTTDFNALLSHALWIFLLTAPLHIPPTTFPPSLSLSSHLLPGCTLPLYAEHKAYRCNFNPGNGQSWEVNMRLPFC